MAMAELQTGGEEPFMPGTMTKTAEAVLAGRIGPSSVTCLHFTKKNHAAIVE
jgi:hypothetical protein